MRQDSNPQATQRRHLFSRQYPAPVVAHPCLGQFRASCEASDFNATQEDSTGFEPVGLAPTALAKRSNRPLCQLPID